MTSRGHRRRAGFVDLDQDRQLQVWNSNSSVLTVRSEAIARVFSHVVSADPALAIPGYAVEREFGWIRILRRQVAEPAVRLWQGYTPTITGGRPHPAKLPTE